MSDGRNRALRITALMVFAQAIDGMVTPTYFPAPMHGAAGAESAGMMHVVLTAVGVLTILLAIVFGAAAYRNWFRFYSVGMLLVVLAFGIIGFSYVPAISANLPTHGSEPRSALTSMVAVGGVVLAIVLLRAEKRPRLN
jgi:hypothetical protein